MTRAGSAAIATALTFALGCSAGRTGEPASSPPPPYDRTPASRAPTTSGNPTSGSPSGGGAAVVYRASTGTAYAFERRDSLVLELPGGAQVQTFDRTAYLHVTLAESAPHGPLRATFVVDSIRAVGGTATVPLDSLRAAQGTRWTGTLTPDGQLTDITGSDTSSIGEQLRSSLRLLFPRLPPGGAKVGATWTDTITTRTRVNAFAGSEDATLTYHATEIDTQGPVRTLRIESSGTFAQNGAGSPFGQPMEMKSTGTRHAVHHLTLDGLVAAAEGGDEGEMTISVPAVGQSVPAHQFSSFTLTALGHAAR